MVDFDPAIMNPASIILPGIEKLTDTIDTIDTSNTTNYIDIIIIAIFLLLVVMIYLRTTSKI
jgi:hypothetical protein